MPTNIEIKCRVRDPERLQELAERLSDTPVEILTQTDIFFRTDSGRLKLRQEEAGEGVLIHYHRANETGPRASHYQMARTTDPETLRQILSDVLGVLGVVRKSRRLYRRGSARIHLDEVEGLGSFLEVEVVLGAGTSPSAGRAEAEELMNRLGMESDALVDVAYIDLMQESARVDLKG